MMSEVIQTDSALRSQQMIRTRMIQPTPTHSDGWFMKEYAKKVPVTKNTQVEVGRINIITHWYYIPKWSLHSKSKIDIFWNNTESLLCIKNNNIFPNLRKISDYRSLHRQYGQFGPWTRCRYGWFGQCDGK